MGMLIDNRIRHTVAYRHLGNAWSSGMMHGRAKLFKAKKSPAGFEIYENDPTSVPEAECVTTVHLASA